MRDSGLDEASHFTCFLLQSSSRLKSCRLFSFSLPQRISAIDIQASFEKFYWKLDRTLADDKKELTAATLRSIALNSPFHG